MGLLNLALGQLFGLYLPLAGLLVALYYYDRSRRCVVVSTLRFWPHRPAPAIRRRHKTIQQPLSLLLQLVAMLLLLLAIADPRPDALGGPARQHVIILDTSAVMAAASDSGVTLMDQAKSRALAYLRALPAGDPVLLIEADGAPSVKVAFTDDREQLRDGISDAQPTFTALDLSSAYDLAAGTFTVDGGGGTGYIDGVTAIPWSVVHGQDPHGRPFVAFRLTFTPEQGDDEHEAEEAIEVLHKRYTDPSSNVWVSAGGNRWLASGAVTAADIEHLSRVLVRTQRAGKSWWIYPTSNRMVESCHHVRYDHNVELVAYEHGDIQMD